VSGCEKTQTSESPSINDRLPKQAQPKLPTLKLYLGAEVLETEIAQTEKQVTTGMMFRTNIQETDSMLFVFPQPQQVSFWMKNCPESLSAAYINSRGLIQEIHHLEKNDTNAVVSVDDTIQYVLEAKEGWFVRHHVDVGTLVRTEYGSLPETFQR